MLAPECDDDLAKTRRCMCSQLGVGGGGLVCQNALHLLNGASGMHKPRHPPACRLQYLLLPARRRQSRLGEHSPQGAQVKGFPLF
jgi:hypothetical protein